MFYESVKSAWEAGKVRVALPPEGHGDRVTVEASGLVGFQVTFLSRNERHQLASLSRDAATAFKNREDAMTKMKTIPLLQRVGEVVTSIRACFPHTDNVGGMSKAEVYACHRNSLVQEAFQANEAERRAAEFLAWGDHQLAEAMFEWADAKRMSVKATELHIEDPNYQVWLNEPDD